MKYILLSSRLILVPYFVFIALSAVMSFDIYSRLFASKSGGYSYILIYFVVWAYGFYLLWSLKKVAITRESLIVSDMFRKSAIPLIYIDSIYHDVHVRPQPIQIKFTQKTDFGNTIYFVPYMSFVSPHPVIAKISKAVHYAKTNHT